MFQRTSVNAYKVAVLGAAGGIGQPLSMLMKSNPIVSKLALYDIANAVGVAADCSHISSPAECKGFNKGDLEECLKGSDIVIIPAGVPRKPGMTRNDLFNTNASIVRDLSTACGKYCKDAAICVISNPVNSTVPIAAEALKAEGAYNPRKLFGVTTLDIMRSKTFVGQAKGMNPFDLSISVVGGHSGPTIVPLLGQTGFNFTQEEIAALTQRIQYGGDEVVKAKDGAGSATLSMAQAAAEFANSLLKATRGDKGITECTYVESPVVEGLEFFATRVELGAKGVEKIHEIGATTAFEKDLLVACKEQLAKDIAKGKAFMKQ